MEDLFPIERNKYTIFTDGNKMEDLESWKKADKNHTNSEFF